MYKRDISKNVVLFLGMVLTLNFLYSACYADETLTITTYYPSPYGSYSQLTADQIAIGSGYRNPAYADGTLYVSGNVGIGTTDPGAKLEVVGQVKITGGSPGANKVLTSDANGLASWQSLGGISYTYYCFVNHPTYGALGTPLCSDAGGTQKYCPSGYTQKLALGAWGFCGNSGWIKYFLPPGGACSAAYGSYGFNVGQAYICSQ